MNLYDHVFDSDIFASFLSSCSPNLNLEEIRRNCYQVKNQFNNIDASNNGGYHSPPFNSNNKREFQKFKELESLVEISESFVNNTLHNRNIQQYVDGLWFWVNINKSYDYNVMHSHGRADLIGIYYVSVPKNSGNLVVLRNDGSQYSNLYATRQDFLEIKISPKEGFLYLLPGHMWHYVEANQSDQDRISISFNVYL